MLLPLVSFSTLLQRMAASVQGSATTLTDLSTGSALRAILEASASVALWLQWLILQVLTVTRAATSAGPDLDSWMADFSLTRMPGAPANGIVTFGRYTAGLPASIPVGTLVRTNDGTLSFTVIANPANPAWDGQSGYDMPATASGVDLPVQAVLAGSAGNVIAGSVGLLSSAIPGVDTVTNATSFGGGVDAELDSALRARFIQYINTRSLATVGAVEFAIASVRQGLRYAVIENADFSGSALPGFFCIAVDDGTGIEDAALVTSVQSAVNAVRPIGTIFSVAGPIEVEASVQVTLETSNPATKSAVTIAVQAAIQSWIAGLPMGGTLARSKLDAIAHSADGSVVSVLASNINGSQSDLVAPANGVIIASSVTVS